MHNGSYSQQEANSMNRKSVRTKSIILVVSIVLIVHPFCTKSASFWLTGSGGPLAGKTSAWMSTGRFEYLWRWWRNGGSGPVRCRWLLGRSRSLHLTRGHSAPSWLSPWWAKHLRNDLQFEWERRESTGRFRGKQVPLCLLHVMLGLGCPVAEQVTSIADPFLLQTSFGFWIHIGGAFGLKQWFFRIRHTWSMVLTLDEESSGKGIGAKGVLGDASVVSSIRFFSWPDT